MHFVVSPKLTCWAHMHRTVICTIPCSPCKDAHARDCVAGHPKLCKLAGSLKLQGRAAALVVGDRVSMIKMRTTYSKASALPGSAAMQCALLVLPITPGKALCLHSGRHASAAKLPAGDSGISALRPEKKKTCPTLPSSACSVYFLAIVVKNTHQSKGPPDWPNSSRPELMPYKGA